MMEMEYVLTLVQFSISDSGEFEPIEWVEIDTYQSEDAARAAANVNNCALRKLATNLRYVVIKKQAVLLEQLPAASQS